MEQRRTLSTHILSGRKNIPSLATMNSASDKHQPPTHRLKILVSVVIQSEAQPTVVQLLRKP